MIKILHNPRCSKSRQTLQLLRDKGIEPEVVEYLKTPLNEREINEILDQLGFQPRELMRANEAAYTENNLKDGSLTREQLIKAMVDYPVLIERPIVISGGKAAIGRPPENVLEIV